MTNFDRVRYRRNDASVFLCAFNLIEVNGDDLRRDPLEVREATLANIVARAALGIWFNDDIEEEDGETVFRHACKPGLEGIVSNAQGLALSLGPLTRLAQDEEPGLRGGKKRGGGGLGT